MKKIVLPLFICSVLSLSGQERCRSVFDFAMDTSAGPQPYTHLRVNDEPCQFQFAIVTDRTGGHRPGVFMDGVNKLNLLQPEFVMSVGDLIEGYTLDTNELRRQWDEFDAFVEHLEMPFFYLPGNHDITNRVMEEVWQKRLGPTYYHFVYKETLFLCLNSEDQRRGAGRGTLSEAQLAYARDVLEQHQDVRWTLVFMHQPLWHQKETAQWPLLEQMLAQRPHTVFAGHEHRYVKEKRNNGKYFTLATTGGGSSLRGPQLGEFDHLMWVTMTDRGPILANLELSGIWSEDVVTDSTKSLLEKMAARPPLSIEPLILTKKGELAQKSFQLTVTNDENQPMQVQLSAHNSGNLGLFAERPTLTVPPNSVETLNLQYLPLTESPDKWEPAQLRAEVSLAAQGEPAALRYPYQFNLKPLPYRPLLRSARALQVDGDLQDWGDLSYHFERDSGRVQVAFDLCYDGDYLYMAALVVDDTVISLGEGAAWRQDNIAFGFNAEKSSRSAMSVGRHWYRYEFLQLATPAYDSIPSVYYREMPAGSRIRCIKTAEGYQAELAVPLSYIIEKQGEHWQSLRVNVGLDDRDTAGISRYGWQPQWRNEDNVVGSGLFWRSEKQR